MQTAEILKQVRSIEIRTGKLVAEIFAGEYKSVFKGHGMEFAEVREYTPGDDIRSIDWNVTARLGKPFIKRFVEERELTLLLACDISGSQQFGTRNKFKSEIAAELAALFSFSALQNSDKVGLLLFSDQVELYIPPKKGKKHALRLIRELLAHQPKNKGTAIGPALDKINRILKRRGIVILISDFIDSGYAKPFRLAAKKHDLIPVVLQDPLEKQMPGLPVILTAQDPETGSVRTLDISAPGVLKVLEKKRRENRAERDALFKTTGTDAITINSDGSITDPVVRFFRARERKFR